METKRFILLPFAWLYGAVLWLRNRLYDWGWLTSTKYSVKTIVVGNLELGGTGKSPHTEYLLKLLLPKHHVATLSRGYKRATTGFVEADQNATAASIGDEPLQFYHKFPEARIVVDESRRNGIAQLLETGKTPDVILLDDAFQHRKVQGGLQILLTRYQRLYTEDWVVPAGRLREPRSGALRADIVVVTKCPSELSSKEQEQIALKLALQPQQQLFFSTVQYTNLYTSQGKSVPLDHIKNQEEIVLFSGIAHPAALEHWLKNQVKDVQHLIFNDHHNFTEEDLQTIRKKIDNIATAKKAILTTEKDWMRLKHLNLDMFKETTVYYLGISVSFLNDSGTTFDKHITDYVGNN